MARRSFSKRVKGSKWDVVLAILLLLAVVAWFTSRLWIYRLVASAVSFASMAFDKYQGRNGGYRVAESYLLLFALVGGWPGTLLGCVLTAHKVQKLSFMLILGSIVCIHVGAAWYFRW